MNNVDKWRPGLVLITLVVIFVGIWVAGVAKGVFSPDVKMVDRDGDGYVAVDREGKTMDCDDSNTNINPGAFDVPDNGVDENCSDGDATLPIVNDNGGAGKTRITLYEDFVFSGPITTERIISNSRHVRSKGRFSSARLYVRADASELNQDPTREHTVYFYMDSGDNGGHLAMFDHGQLVGTFSGTADDGVEFENIYDLSLLRLGDLNSTDYKEINFLDILNHPGDHYIGSFVPTGKYGILRELSIEYDCTEGSECLIESVR